MTTYKCLLYDVKDGIATLTLNNPTALNAVGRAKVPKRERGIAGSRAAL